MEGYQDTVSRGPPQEYWNKLSQEDQTAYLQLKETLGGENSTKSRHQSGFQKDLNLVRNFIERRPDQQDLRSIVCGIYFGGKYVCVNTRQLKYLIGRCKSSINNGLQSMGYISSKQRVRQIILSVLPPLANDGATLRQWTLRSAEQTFSPVAAKSIYSPMSLPKPIPLLRERTPLPMPMINMTPQVPKSPPAEISFPTASSRASNDMFALPAIDMFGEPTTFLQIPRPLSTPISTIDHNILDPLDDLVYSQSTDFNDVDGLDDPLRTDNDWFGIN